MTQTPNIDAAVDASIDTPPDTAQSLKYDIVYINEVTQSTSISSLFSFLVVVNKGTVALNTSTAEVVSFTDDNPGLNWTFVKDANATKPLDPGLAAGALSVLSRMKIVDSGAVTEPIADPYLNFAASFREPPPAGLTLNAQAVLRIEGKEVILPFVFHIIASGDPVFHSTNRISSQP